MLIPYHGWIPYLFTEILQLFAVLALDLLDSLFVILSTRFERSLQSLQFIVLLLLNLLRDVRLVRRLEVVRSAILYHYFFYLSKNSFIHQAQT